MKDWDGFLKKWATALKKYKSNRTDTLLLEATCFIKGIGGVNDLARKWGKNQPRGYLYWIQKLIQNEDWGATSKACLEALKALPNSSFREQVAKYLVKTGIQLENKKLILKGKREKFISSPSETSFLDLTDEANQQNVREKELGNLLKVFNNLTVPSFRENTLYAKLLLMTGNVKAAFDDAKKVKSVGWSYGKAGLIFGSVLYVVCGKSDKATIIIKILESYANGSGVYSWSDDSGLNTNMYDEILNGLNQCKVSSSDLKTFFE